MVTQGEIAKELGLEYSTSIFGNATFDGGKILASEGITELSLFEPSDVHNPTDELTKFIESIHFTTRTTATLYTNTEASGNNYRGYYTLEFSTKGIAIENVEMRTDLGDTEIDIILVSDIIWQGNDQSTLRQLDEYTYVITALTTSKQSIYFNNQLSSGSGNMEISYQGELWPQSIMFINFSAGPQCVIEWK